MIKVCTVCQSMFEEPVDEFEKKKPLVCGPECFSELLKKVGEERHASMTPGKELNGFTRRSTWEIIFECVLERYHIYYLYEKETIQLKNGDWYLPDYYLPQYDVYLEVKGLWQPKAKRKVRLFPTEKKIFLILKPLLDRLKISSKEKEEALKRKYVLH